MFQTSQVIGGSARITGPVLWIKSGLFLSSTFMYVICMVPELHKCKKLSACSVSSCVTQQCLYLLTRKQLFLNEFQKQCPKIKRGCSPLKNRTVSKGARCLFEWLVDNLKHLIEVSIYNNYACQCKLLWRKEEVVWVNYCLNLRPGKSQWGTLFFPLAFANWRRGHEEVRRAAGPLSWAGGAYVLGVQLAAWDRKTACRPKPQGPG